VTETITSGERDMLRDLLCLALFLAMLVGPAFAALDIFVEKNNRF
jgi:hypothetical protein